MLAGKVFAELCTDTLTGCFWGIESLSRENKEKNNSRYKRSVKNHQVVHFKSHFGNNSVFGGTVRSYSILNSGWLVKRPAKTLRLKWQATDHNSFRRHVQSLLTAKIYNFSSEVLVSVVRRVVCLLRKRIKCAIEEGKCGLTAQLPGVDV